MTPKVIFVLLALMAIAVLAFAPIETWLTWATLGAAMVGWGVTGRRWRHDRTIVAGGILILAADWYSRFGAAAIGG